MLDFIKSQIKPKHEDTITTPYDVPNETILEYASVFQELDDLSEHGDEEGKTRKLSVDIPLLEDADITPTTIEFDLGTGTVTDVLNDKTVVESSYEGMKTFDQFYKEAVEAIPRFARESDASYDARVTEYANELYTEYCNDATEFGYYGFNSVSLDDERVPSKMTVDFGSITQESDTSFIGKVNVFFATDENHKITKKQLDSIARVKAGAFKGIGSELKTYMESQYTIPEAATLWDVCTPKNLIVPKGNGDSFCVVLEYTNELTGKSEFYGWTCPVVENASEVTMESCIEINKESFVNESHYENKDLYLKAVAEEASQPVRVTKRPISRFVQESIDFGTEGGTDADTSNAGGDAAPAPAPAEPTANADGAVDTGNASDAPEGNDTDTNGENKEQVNVNDVSSEIADKVAEKQEDMDPKTGAIDGETITFDDGTSITGDAGGNTDTSVSIDEETPAVEEPAGDTSSDMDTGDASMSVDDQLADLDTSAGDDMDNDENPIPGVDDNGDIDLDSMTIDQLIEQGSEKLKSMPLGEIKNFLQSGSPEEVGMESFIITSNNVNDAVAANIRKCLGVLNEQSIPAGGIFNKFSQAGHKLNRVLTKAGKMTKIYSADEINSIKKLNTSLAELLVLLKKRNKNSDVNKIKAAIKSFTSDAKAVSAFAEKKVTGKPVQENADVTMEAFLLNNISDKITKALIPVKGDMEELKKAHDAGGLSRGKIIKRYSAKVTNAYVSFGYSEKSSNMPGEKHSFRGYSIAALNIDRALKLLNKALRKKNVDKIDLISALADKLDLISDYIETVIDDRIENTEMVKRIGILAGDIIGLIDQYDEDSAIASDDVETNDVEDSETVDIDQLSTDDDESDTTTDTPDEEGGDDAEADTDEEADTDSDIDVEDKEDEE